MQLLDSIHCVCLNDSRFATTFRGLIMNNGCQILSLDGGGIRGLITSIWLNKLEEELAEQYSLDLGKGGILHRFFHIVVGTSTGSILACGISNGIPANRIEMLYRDYAERIFHSRSKWLGGSLGRFFDGSLWRPKYRSDGLHNALDKEFEQTTFGDLMVKPTLITAYNAMTRHSVIFDNSDKEDQPYLVKDLCIASSSAPTYFPGHVMSQVDTATPFLDGGIVANNPVVYAIAKSQEMERDQSASWPTNAAPLVLSFGTGRLTRMITVREARKWGSLKWLSIVIELLFDGSSRAMDQMAAQLVGKENYIRIQTSLTKGIEQMDDPRTENLDALAAFAANYLREGGKQQIKDIADKLELLNEKDLPIKPRAPLAPPHVNGKEQDEQAVVDEALV